MITLVYSNIRQSMLVYHCPSFAILLPVVLGLLPLALSAWNTLAYQHGHTVVSSSQSFLHRNRQNGKLEQQRTMTLSLQRRIPVHASSSSSSLHATKTSTKRTAPSEVAKMFDDFSASFEDKLVNTLKYSAPLQVAQTASKRIIEDRKGQLYKCALDAGCGTGLMGPHLRHLVDGPLVGVDLSPKMLQLAAELVIGQDAKRAMKAKEVVDTLPSNENESETNSNTTMLQLRRCTETARQAFGNVDRLYDGIFVADLLDLSNSAKPLEENFGFSVETLPTKGTPYDLIACADVLCYFGEMDTVLSAFSHVLAPGGDLIFSTETIAQGDYNWIMLSSERYAHNPEYIARMAVEAGFVVVSQEAFTPRMELDEKVLGTLHTFHKP